MNKRVGLSLFLLLVFISFLLFILTSCQKSENLLIKGKITINKTEFYIKDHSGIYDIEINFESTVSFNLEFIDEDLKDTLVYNQIKSLKLAEIDLTKYDIKCVITDQKGIPQINYKINLIKKNYWYKSRYESEPNNSFDTSTDFIISSYNTYSKVGRLLNKEDTDFYKIYNNTYFNISCYISLSKASKDSYSATLYDSKHNLIARVKENIPFFIKSQTYYYLKISNNENFIDLPYVIIIKPTTSIENYSEFEPNNSMEQANNINLNQLIYGELVENDIDYFSFDIQKEGSYKIVFSSNSFPFSITLISDFGEFYGEYQMHRAGSFRHLLLPEGRYHLKLIPINQTKISNFEYTLKIENDSKTFETEPNDNENQANEFTIFDIVTGSISWEYDVDYFYILLENPENNIIINNEDFLAGLSCQIFVDDKLDSTFELKGETQIINIKGQKVIIKLYSTDFIKDISYSITVGN